MGTQVKKIGKIKSWDEGLPLGNGSMGSLFYGENTLLCALDKAGLWDTRPSPESLEEGFVYSEMVRLVKAGDEASWKEMCRRFSGCYGHTTPTKINAGILALDVAVSDATRYCLDIQTACLEIESGENRLHAFISGSSEIGYIRSKQPVGYEVQFPSYYYAPYINRNASSLDTAGAGLGYEKASRQVCDEIEYHLQKTAIDGTFAIAVKRGKIGEEHLLAYTVLTGADEEEIFQKGKALFAVDYAKDYEKHLRYWKGFWAESSLSLPDKKLERLYELSYYLFASGNREGGLPMPLQGVWTNCSGNLPPWKGDYHHDLNTQFTYTSYLKANHLQTGKVFIDYLWRMRDSFRAFAKSFYGVEGLLAPAVSSVDGQALGGWPMYSLSPTMSIWLAQSFADYYAATADEAFFTERAYPFFSEVTEAILGLMEEKDGKLYLPLSSSPEYNDAEPNSFFVWSNNDLQLVRYALKTMIAYDYKLGKDTEKYEAALSKLDEEYVDEKGVFLLDDKQYVEETHRHHSNLMCVYPLKTVTAQGGKNIPQIERNLERLELLGTGLWVGFSFPWFACLSAMGYFGNRALQHLQTFEKCFVAENGFHLNGDFKKYGVSLFHYRPFTLEANYCYCAALQEMLLQEHEGYLHLFPAMPTDWQEERVAFENFLSGGCLLSATREKGAITRFEIKSKEKRTIAVKNVFGREELTFSNGQTIRCAVGESFMLTVDEKGCALL